MAMCVSQPAYYRIYVQGILDAHWLCNYVDLQIELVSSAGGQIMTKLAGELIDQAALLGVLNLIGELGAPLLAFECIPYGEVEERNRGLYAAFPGASTHR